MRGRSRKVNKRRNRNHKREENEDNTKGERRRIEETEYKK